MIYTNKHELPEHLVKLLTVDNYDKGDADYSVTELFSPPRVTQLRRRHDDKITCDVMDNFFSFDGNCLHDYCENNIPRTKKPRVIAEQRFYIDIVKYCESYKVGGKLDLLYDDTLIDFKKTSVGAVIHGSKLQNWSRQLNAYKYILNKNGVVVTRLQINAFLRDWHQNNTKRQNYPKAPIQVFEFEMIDNNIVKQDIESRLDLHIQSAHLPDDDLPECTPDECWERQGSWAVRKTGNSRATKTFNDLYTARQFCKTKGSEYTVEQRPGLRIRCEQVCPVANFCNQFARYKNEK